MSLLLPFLIKHWLMSLCALVSALWILLPALFKGVTTVPEVTPSAAVTLMNREKPLLLDVRQASELATGTLVKAKCIALPELANRMTELAKFKDKPIIVYCAAGKRGAAATMMLQKAGFTKVHNLTGGLNAWREAGLPVTAGVVDV